MTGGLEAFLTAEGRPTPDLLRTGSISMPQGVIGVVGSAELALLVERLFEPVLATLCSSGLCLGVCRPVEFVGLAYDFCEPPTEAVGVNQ